MPTIGIDAIALSVPRGHVDLTDLASARGVPASKYLDGLGTHRMAVAAPGRGPRSRWPPTPPAAPSPSPGGDPGGDRDVHRGHRDGRRSRRARGRLPPRPARPALGLPRLRDQARLLRRHRRPLQRRSTGSPPAPPTGAGAALVVCTDIARYALGSAGEPTQGAGAVALIVAERPRLLALDVGRSGSYARDVYDFWRPLDAQGRPGRRPLLRAVLPRRAGRRLRGQSGPGAGRPPGDEAPVRTCYHVPYGKMARKAYRARRRDRRPLRARPGRRHLRRRGRRLAGPALARGEHLHGEPVPGPRVPAPGGEAAAVEGGAEWPLQLRLRLLGRVLRRPRRPRARARSPIRSSWRRRSRIAGKYTFAEYEQIRLRDDEARQAPGQRRGARAARGRRRLRRRRRRPPRLHRLSRRRRRLSGLPPLGVQLINERLARFAPATPPQPRRET